MALNITFDGYCFMEDDGISSSNVAYQAYFYKANSGSSSSKWNNKRIVENTGYFNINLGDGDFLSQDGSAASNDVIIIVFWSPAYADRMDACVTLNEWSCFRIILDGSSTYSNNVQVRSNMCPNLNWTLPNTSLMNTNVVANNTSTDTHQWDYFGNTMYHRNSWYTTLMNVNTVNNSSYSWGDGNENNNLAGTTNGVHSWSTAGDYDIEIVIEDSCGCTVTGTKQIRVYGNPPVPNIVMIPSNPLPNEVVTFQYSGTDIDDVITNIAWTIEDGSTDTISAINGRDTIIYHTEGLGTDWYGQPANSGAFTNFGNHQVSIVVTWWDGFQNQTINYSEIYTQNKFSGPVIDFTQVPIEAEKNNSISFNNLSTNISRVGLGLPNHVEYTWRWTDGTLIETETDKPFTYVLEKIPTTASCKVQLCAQWSDGWDTYTTCVEKDVVFKTTVTISEEDCYYNLNLIGTSDDGSITGYGWTIYSGSGEVGPWSSTWSSPVGLEQNDKKICFTSVGWYKIEGAVYGIGNTTFDDEIVYITTVCPAGDSIFNIWNGTGIQDVGSDWTHSNFGTETEQSKHTGTNGLDASGMSKNNKITFSAPGTSSITADDYDFLRLWVSVRSWQVNKDISLFFKTTAGPNSNSVNLSSYININNLNSWQKVLIPLTDFNFSPAATYLNKLEFIANGDIDVWLDNITLTIGTVEVESIAICPPDVYGKQLDDGKKMKAREIKPGLKGRLSIQPSARIIQDNRRPFPGPTNI